MGTVAAVVLALALIATYLTWTASRMDRLHARTDTARAALDAQLVRRAAAALEIATASDLTPLREAAAAGYHSSEADREETESELSRAIRAAAGALSTDARAELVDAGRRVVLARQFYNDAVRDTCAFRQRRVVRALRLVGHAKTPQRFEIDDTPPISEGPVSSPITT